MAGDGSINSHLLPRVIIDNETSCFQNYPETIRQSIRWKSPSSPRPKKAYMSRSQFQTVLVCFLDYKGIIVHQEFIQQDKQSTMLFTICVTSLVQRMRTLFKSMYRYMRGVLRREQQQLVYSTRLIFLKMLSGY